MSKRIDELTAHPKSAADPLSLSSDLVLRDADLGSDNTRKVTLGDVRPGGSVSITDFGADPTGVADSTAAIQAAFDYLNNNSKGGIVFAPQGEYKITQVKWYNGISLRGVGIGSTGAVGTTFVQSNGVNASAFIPDTSVSSYSHWTEFRDFFLKKATPVTDTLGSGIDVTHATGEGFGIHHVMVQDMPKHGIAIAGAAPCYLTDLHLMTNGQSGAGYGLYFHGDTASSFQTTQVNMVSGDDNKDGLIGIYSAGGMSFSGIKSESSVNTKQLNVFVLDTTNAAPIWIHNVGVANGHSSGNAIVKILNASAEVMVSHIYLSGGSTAPAYVIDDHVLTNTVAWPATNDWLFMLMYSDHAGTGGEVFRLDGLGYSGSIARDPVPQAGQVGLGITTGIGDGAGTNLQAPAKGTGTGPTTLTANKWIRFYNGTTAGWIPFFI